MLKKFVTTFLLAAASPALAGGAPATTVPVATVPPVSAPDLQLSAAKRIAGKLLPDGTYRKMMTGTLDKVLSGMMDQMSELPIRQLAAIGGITPEQAKSIGPGSLKEMMAILDPAFDQRMKITMTTTMGGMVDLMSKMEPSVRDGLAEAYASHFSQSQLGELEAFFATPTGNAYAAQSMLVYTDPAVMNRMQAMFPEIVKAMPAIMQKATAATASLPKPRTMEQLTPAERAKLKQLMGSAPARRK
jgi:Uncharacterized protein conserved in bacteria (DUF2059)